MARSKQKVHIEVLIEVCCQNFEGVWFGVACNQEEIVSTSFGASEKKTLTSILASIPFDVPFQVSYEPSAFAESVLDSLKKIFVGRKPDNTFSFAYAPLPAYTQKVLKVTMQIPIGYVTSYGSIAKAVGGGARAVGNIMASNRFAPIVPCHRVVKSDFTLGGYGGGLKTKVELLNREKKGFFDSMQVQVEGGFLKVFPIEYVLRNLGSW